MTGFRFKKFRTICAVVLLFTGLGFGACSFDIMEMRFETANHIAMPSFMLHREIPAEPFMLTVYERVHKKGESATIYIEGDGVAWVSKRRPSLDPTPKNPVALHLASRDNSPNVIYMARPCQYSKKTTSGSCEQKYWTSDRFSPDVIDSMNAALDNIKRRYDIPAFSLVGFSGGGAVAALLTAKRDDVTSLRTVAGNLDHVALNAMHGVSQMPGSLNPADIAAAISNVPQHHFIGDLDKIVTTDIYDSFREKAGPSSCIKSSMVKNVSHEKGWVNIWPELLAIPLDCQSE